MSARNLKSNVSPLTTEPESQQVLAAATDSSSNSACREQASLKAMRLEGPKLEEFSDWLSSQLLDVEDRFRRFQTNDSLVKYLSR